ncbi:MAG: serine hydroxymethyltransferase [Phycisphaerales bacterium]|jgi:glycine hydroxymethyltransferase
MLLDRYRRQTDRQKSSKKVYELIAREHERLSGCEGYHSGLLEILKQTDSQIYELLYEEYERQRNCLQLLAAENQCSRAVLAVLGSVLQNKTAEGFTGARFHGGCEVVDEVEALAIERAKNIFGAKYANVQPHSGSTANQIVFQALLNKGDTILSLDCQYGGHPSHGANGSVADSVFRIETYGVEQDGFVFDYDKIREKAIAIRPKLILCGASAYPRMIDFERFRAIADEVGAYLLADISHIAALVIGGVHPSPIDFAHVTTTSTYKAGGPRGGLILSGKDYQTHVGENLPLAEAIEQATFPGVQGTPYFNNIAAKAVFFNEAMSSQYKARQARVVENAGRLAEGLLGRGFDVLGRGTDTHMILVDVCGFRAGLNGILVQRLLEDCGIVVDAYRLGYEDADAPASGIRLGTPVVTRRGMGTRQMDMAAEMIAEVLEEVTIHGRSEYELTQIVKSKVSGMVGDMCENFTLA